eukprot:4945-Heterococcus_DN1.PRE.2
MLCTVLADLLAATHTAPLSENAARQFTDHPCVSIALSWKLPGAVSKALQCTAAFGDFVLDVWVPAEAYSVSAAHVCAVLHHKCRIGVTETEWNTEFMYGLLTSTHASTDKPEIDSGVWSFSKPPNRTQKHSRLYGDLKTHMYWHRSVYAIDMTSCYGEQYGSVQLLLYVVEEHNCLCLRGRLVNTTQLEARERSDLDSSELGDVERGICYILYQKGHEHATFVGQRAPSRTSSSSSHWTPCGIVRCRENVDALFTEEYSLVLATVHVNSL